MNRAFIHFTAVLHDFFLAGKDDSLQDYRFEGKPSIKHVIEALGVPHTEVGSVQVNGIPVDLSYLLQDGDRVEVFGVSQPDEVGSKKTFLPENKPLVSGEPRFVLDNHLGKLAAYLRILGFDAFYQNDLEDAQLAQIANQQNRILLTRDRRLLMRSLVTSGYCVRDLLPDRQILEVIRRYNLYAEIRPFRRCLRCNGILKPIDKKVILDRLQPLTQLYFDEFRICPDCDQVYWKGSHYERMLKLVDRVVKSGEDNREE